MIKYLTLILIIVVSASQVTAQSFQPYSARGSHDHYCSSDHVHLKKMASDPDYRTKHEAMEDDIYQVMSSKSAKNPTKAQSQYIVPIVFHIIHNNGPENISDALVMQGLQDLNDAFENIGYYDQGTGVDIDIEFCLATRDPDGFATTGITRDVSVLTDLDYNVDDLNLKNINRWDPTRYVNVWVVKEICGGNLGCGVAGYAYLPGAHGSNVDGIVLEANFLGSSNANDAVIIHELGHYLGLRHTFQGGCPNDDCLLDGDRICDTPPDNSTAAVPCAASANSCTTDVNLADPNNPFLTDQNDMFINYMDYGSFSCYSAFTAGQRDRMQAVITGVRSSLLSSNGCDPPCLDPLTAGFTASTDNIIAGQSVSFTNTSVNGTTWDWQIDGTSFSSMMNSSYMFNSAGTFTVTLFAYNDDPNCSSSADTTITVICDTNAAFSASETTVQTGTTVTFNDASVNVTNYNWTIDNVPFSSLANPDFTFNTPGNFTVCLEGDNGICNDMSCQTIFVNSEPPENCNNTFFKIVGDPLHLEQGLSIFPSDDGNFFLTGMRGDSALIMKMTPSGDFIWQRSFDITNRPDQILDLKMASDGNLIGVGQGTSGAVSRNPFYFKYDPVSDNFSWVRDVSYFNGYFSRIHEADSASNYLISGSITDPRDILITSINPFTGNEQWTRRNSLGTNDDSESAIFYNNDLYSTGRQNPSSSVGTMRGAVTRFNTDGTYDYNRYYLETINQNVRHYTTDLLVHHDSLVLAFFLDKNGTGPTYTPTMAKTDLDGNIAWAKDYEIMEYPNVRTKNVIEVPGGYLLHGYTITPLGRVFLIKTDYNGNTEWGRVYGGVSGTTDINVLNINRVPRSQVAYYNNFIYFNAGAWNFGDFNEDLQIFIGKLNLDGTVDEENCPLVQDVTIIETDFINPVDQFTQFTELMANQLDISVSPNSGNPDMEEQLFCQELCTEIDFDILGESLVCLSEDPLTYRFDNLSDCEPTALTWEVLGGNMISSGGDSLIVELPNIGAASIIAHAELNCFSLSDTLDIMINDSLNLDLGPDINVCHNATFTLNAGEGFSRYEWFDGSADSTYSVWLTGDYWVETEDACGNILRDSIHITIEDTELVITNQFSEICPGESVTVTLSGYDNYQWFPSTGLGCDNCPSNTISPTQTVGYYVVASTNVGCISVDTIGITIPEFATAEIQTICAGESALIFGTPQTQEGDYSQLFSTADGCDSTHTVSLVVLDTFYTTETLTLCSDESPFPDGTVIESLFQAQNGCDSTHAVIYSVLDTFYTTETLTLCSDESPFPDGTIIESLFQAQNGCDSTHAVIYSVLDTFYTTETLTLCSDESPFPDGTVIESLFQAQNGCDSTHAVIYSVLDTFYTTETLTLCSNESPFPDGTVIESLFQAQNGCDSTHAVIYSVLDTFYTTETLTLCSDESPFPDGTVIESLFQAQNGCDSTHAVTYDVLPVPSVQIGSTAESCIGDDGSIMLTFLGGAQPFTYLWDASAGNATTATVTGLSEGNYQVTVTGNDQCESIIQATVMNACSCNIALNLTGTDELTCFGDQDGFVAALASGGSGNYTYNWSANAGGQMTSTITGLGPGIYNLTLNDGPTCLTEAIFTISEPDPMFPDIIGNDSDCGEMDASAFAFVAGGVAPFTYVWSTGETGSNIQNLPSGNYSFTVTDANGCMEEASAFITSEGVAPVVTAEFVNSSCVGANDGSIDISVIGGEGPFTYMWSDGVADEDRTGLPPGVYTVWVTDTNGCLAITTIIISESGDLTLDFNSTPSTGTDGTASVTVFGGASPFTYQWNNGGTDPFINNLAPGTYTVSVTDANGCTGTGNVVVSPFTGTYPINALELFEVTPNPNSGQFEVHIQFDRPKDFRLEVYNIPGQLLYEIDRNGNVFREQINLGRVPAGLYFVTVRTAEGLAAKPVIVLD
ncbi:MAG: M43 family zinc metalloprotease [Bacteroidota bacterium]